MTNIERGEAIAANYEDEKDLAAKIAVALDAQWRAGFKHGWGTEVSK